MQPLLYWPLDGNGNNIGAQTGYGLTLNGSVSFVIGKFGQAAAFASGAFGQVVLP